MKVYCIDPYNGEWKVNKTEYILKMKRHNHYLLLPDYEQRKERSNFILKLKSRVFESYDEAQTRCNEFDKVKSNKGNISL